MKKVINPGKRTSEGNVFCTIKFVDGKLSITGVVGPMKNGNCKGSCGQINPLYINRRNLAEGWTFEMLNKFNQIWADWHLNDFRAGNKTQMDFLKLHPEAKSYDEQCELLKDVELYEDNGIKYGYTWQKEEVPSDVIAFLESLPESKLLHPWGS